MVYRKKMSVELGNFMKHPLVRKSSNLENIRAESLDTLTQTPLILQEYCGIDFSYDKEYTILRYLERR